MKKINISTLLASIAMMGIMASCSSEDDGIGSYSHTASSKQEVTKTSGDATTFDQVSFLQDNIIELDSLGNIRQRITGAMLNSSDTTELYVGAKDIDAATKKFMSWLSPDTRVSTSSPSTVNLEVPLTDGNGNVVETAYFKQVEGEGEKIAEVTFAKKNVLKHFTKIVFRTPFGSGKKNLLAANSNGGITPYYLGETCAFETVYDGVSDYVCVREPSDGESGLMVHISPDGHMPGLNAAQRMGNLSLAKTVSEIIRSDWDRFDGYFKKAGVTLDKNGYYWVDKYNYFVLALAVYGIRLSDGDIDWFMYREGNADKHTLEIKAFGLIPIPE